jgi:hypothetical protein
MKKEVKEQLKELLDSKRVKIPAVAAGTGIPADRIRAWYRDNTKPKADDQKSLEAYIKKQTPAGAGRGEGGKLDEDSFKKYVDLLESHNKTLEKGIGFSLEQLIITTRLIQAQGKTTLQELAKMQAKGNGAAEEKILEGINKRLAENYASLSKTDIAGSN